MGKWVSRWFHGLTGVGAECYRYGFMGREVYGLVLKVLASDVEDCALRLSFYTFIPSFFSLKQLVYSSLTPSAAMMSS